jgi:hypothetical protein
MHSTDSDQTKHHWLRWIALPFAAFLGAPAGAFLVTMLWWLPQKFLGGWNEEGACFQYILPCVSSGFCGGFFVAISMYVAPRGKAVAALVMTTALCVLLLLGHALLLIYGIETVGVKIFASIQLVVLIVSAIATLANLYNDPAWTRTP